MIKRDLHIHSIYCDGKDCLEDIVITAVEKGFETIGFSSHSYTGFDKGYSMKREDTDKYISEISALKKKYKDKIEILCGLEMDYYSDIDTKDFDYVIGSVHYVYKEGVYLSVDNNRELFSEQVKKYYNGDYLKFVKDYYEVVSDLKNKHNPDIIGHIDLVTKFNEGEALFSENEEYLAYAYKAIDILTETPCVFEVNTGAISRGYRTEPYPSKPLLERILKRGGKVIINSDSHNKENIGYYFEEAEEYLKKCVKVD